MITLTTVFWVGLIAVMVEGFFSGSEIAMVSASRARLRQRASAGDRGARMVEGFLARPQVLLATTLIGTNIATVGFSVTVALFLLQQHWGSSELLAVAMVTPTTLILGEVVPKTLFQQHADRLCTIVVYPLRGASIVLRPGVWALSAFASFMTRLLGTDKKRAFITREELVLLIEAEAGPRSEITPSEREIISNVLESFELEVEDVMVPLSELTALAEDVTVGEAALEVADKQHSRMPIYRSRVDDVVGVLHVFDLLRAGPTGKAQPVSQIMRPAHFAPPNRLAVDLLVELQAAGEQMAIVVDEYGGAIGVVTMEDIVEEIVGDIEDEYDAGPSPIHLEKPGVWRVEGKTPVARVNQELGLELPESDAYESLAGLMLDRLKHIPDAGESLTVAGAVLKVREASDRAIESVEVTRRRKR